MANPAVIRPEFPSDYASVYTITASAFGRDSEADLNNLLRDADALILSQVAEIEGEIVGHAAYSLVSITDDREVSHFPALGPIAVAPAFQRQGIGSKLVRAGLTAMSQAGYGLLFLVGHVSYYPRFGFQPAQPLGFTSDYVKVDGPHEHFMAAVLDAQLLDSARGHVRFHPAFDAV